MSGDFDGDIDIISGLNNFHRQTYPPHAFQHRQQKEWCFRFLLHSLFKPRKLL
jgi:hypothetical protein